MKILISNDSPTAHYYIRLGFAGALTLSGHEVIIWDLDKKNAFDAFDEFNPDIFVSQGYNLNDSIIECIRRRPELKVSLKCGDWGKPSQAMDLKKYPILTASDKEIALVTKLQKLTGRPNLIDIHYPQKYANETHEFWNTTLGIKICGLMSGADIVDYTRGQFNEKYKSDLAFVGGRWGYKSQTIDRWILPLLNPELNLNFKIFGNQPWGVPQYAGFIETKYIKDILASATICPNISEPHSQDFGYDIVERPFKLLSNKCFVISDAVKGLQELFSNDEIVFANNPTEFRELVEHYLKYPEERIAKINKGYLEVINKHTYFHRAAQFFEALDISTESIYTGLAYAKEKLCL